MSRFLPLYKKRELYNKMNIVWILTVWETFIGFLECKWITWPVKGPEKVFYGTIIACLCLKCLDLSDCAGETSPESDPK